MGNLEISSIKNENLKKLAIDADTKFVDDEKTSGNGNKKIDTIFEESALRGKIRTGIANKTLTVDSEVTEIMSQLGLEITKTIKADLNNNYYETLKNRFDNMQNAMIAEHKDQIKKDGGVDYEKMLKAFKKELKASGEWKQPGVKDAYKELKEYAIGKAELMNNKATIQDFQNPEEGTHVRAVRTRGRRVLGIESSVLFGHKTEDYGNRKLTEEKQEIAENTKNILENIEKSKHLTEKEVHDMLTDLGFWRRTRSFAKDLFGSKIYDLPNKMKPYLEAHKNADGTYDLSELATYDPREDNRTDNGKGYQYGGIIFNASYDEINKHNDPKLNEFENVKKGLEQLTGTSLTDGEVKVLAKNIFGIDTQTRNHSFKSAVKEGLGLPLVEGAATGFTFGIYAQQKVKIAASTRSEAVALAKSIGKTADAVKDLGNGEFGLFIEQLADLKALCALGGASETLLINILANMIFGVEEDEQTCFNILRNLPNDNRIAVEKYVRKELPDKADAVMMAIDMYIEKFDGDESKAIAEFNKQMSINGGSGSVMNPKECFIQILMMKPEKVEEQAEEVTFKGKKVCTPGVETPVKVNTPRLNHNEDWGVFASRYDCIPSDLDPDFNKKVRDEKTGKLVPGKYARTMMKVMQAINDNNYDLARLQKLTRAAIAKDYETLKAENGFDFKTYYDLRKGGIVNQKVPTITTIDENNVKVDVCKPGEAKYSKKYTGGKGTRVDAQGDYRNVRNDGTFDGSLEDSKGVKYHTTNEKLFNEQVKEWEKTKRNKGIEDNCQ